MQLGKDRKLRSSRYKKSKEERKIIVKDLLLKITKTKNNARISSDKIRVKNFNQNMSENNICLKMNGTGCESWPSVSIPGNTYCDNFLTVKNLLGLKQTL